MERNWAGRDDVVKLIRNESAIVGPLIKELRITID